MGRGCWEGARDHTHALTHTPAGPCAPPRRPTAQFKQHNGPVTSVEWDPNDDTVLAVGGDDHQISVWDFSVTDKKVPGELPKQLLFLHHAQKHVKELHFHPQLPGVIMSTALTGFNVFKPAVEADDGEEEEEEMEEGEEVEMGGGGGGGGGGGSA